MDKTRNSSVVKFGRLFQRGYKYVSFLDNFAKPLLISRKKNEIPVVCIVAPPRSGSTLTYQLLTSFLQNFHLTNIWNLLYATPALGAFMSRLSCGNYSSPLQSHNGFVPGICGEAEGKKFWTYWCGQGLYENKEVLDEKKLSDLYATLKGVSPGKPFITGYIGHAFCMGLLRKIIPNIIFVHVTRDLLSNAYSIYQRSNNGGFSLMPERLQGKNFNSTHEQVVEQLFGIHEAIIKESNPDDTIQIRYEDLCEDAQCIIDRIINFSKKRGVELEKKPDFNVQSLQVNRVQFDANADTRLLQQFIDRSLSSQKQHFDFFKAIS